MKKQSLFLRILSCVLILTFSFSNTITYGDIWGQSLKSGTVPERGDSPLFSLTRVKALVESPVRAELRSLLNLPKESFPEFENQNFHSELRQTDGQVLA